MSSSILASYNRAGHYADVKMHLSVADHTLSVRQLGPDYLLLEFPIDHPPTMGTLFFSIDGNARERQIQLPEGISARSRGVVIAKV